MRTTEMVALSIAVVANLTTERAEACSYYGCVGGYLVPGYGRTIPASAPALLWVPRTLTGGDSAKVVTAENVQLTAEGGGAQIPVAVINDAGYPWWPWHEIVPKEPLKPGLTYTVQLKDFCCTEGGTEECEGEPDPAGVFQSFTFSTVEAAALPSTLGQVVVDLAGVTKTEVATAGGSCETDVLAARVSVVVELSAEASPWKDILVFRTEVDGHWYVAKDTFRQEVTGFPPGESWTGRGSDLLYAICEPADCDPDAPYSDPGACNDPGAEPGLTEGTHNVRFVATLPGTDIEIATPPVEVTLLCQPAGSGDGLAGDAADSGGVEGEFKDSPAGSCAIAIAAECSLGPVVAPLLLLALVRGRRSRNSRVHDKIVRGGPA